MNQCCRKYDLHHLLDFDPARATKLQMPMLKKETAIPGGLIDFTAALRSRKWRAWVHFYLDDYRFERLWKEPDRYLPLLKKFAGCLSPDFSLYRDMPYPMQFWNTYRSRLLTQMMQDADIAVIPSVSWSDATSYDFAFDGIPQGSTVSISTHGCLHDCTCRRLFTEGLAAMIARLKPERILLYGKAPATCDFGKIEVIFYPVTSYEWKNRLDKVSYREYA